MGKAKFLLLSAILVMCVGVMTGCGKENTDDGNKASSGIRGSASEVITNTKNGINELETDITKKSGELETVFQTTIQAQTR